MKYLIKSLTEIEKKIRTRPGCLLFLDFDGTLAALTPTPAQAILSKKNKLLLQQASRLMPTAIVTGRSLADIKQKVGIKNLIYAGNHGLEWQIAGKQGKIRIPAKMIAAIDSLRRPLSDLCEKYPGALVENKNLGLALHYRLVSPCLASQLLKEAKQLITPFQRKQLLKITESKKTLDIRPALLWNKGTWIKFLQKKINKQLLPIYIGDDITDEDVFKILQPGITIKVGINRESKANYYCHNIKQVGLFLNWLIKLNKSSVLACL